jgi:predicted deacylase
MSTPDDWFQKSITMHMTVKTGNRRYQHLVIYLRLMICSGILMAGFQISTALGQQAPFVLEGRRVAAGQKVSFDIPVIAASKDSTFIPVTVIHGQNPGPVIGLIAGIHGFEYPPIMAMQEMARELSPASLSGTAIIVHIANVKAFFGRSVYYNPVDGKNLNREFPGDKNGSLTQCIAWVLSQQILPRCNYLVDIHAGDASEDLHDYVGYYVHGEQTDKAKQMAEALGFDWIMKSATDIVKGQPTLYCSKEAVAQGIPTVAIECGKLGKVSFAEVKKINNGLLNMMRSLQLLPGAVETSNKPLEITKRNYISSEHTGIFYSDCKSGQLIREGMKLGYVTDVKGNLLSTIYAPADGFIVYQIATPPVNKGEILFSLGSL